MDFIVPWPETKNVNIVVLTVVEKLSKIIRQIPIKSRMDAVWGEHRVWLKKYPVNESKSTQSGIYSTTTMVLFHDSTLSDLIFLL